MLKAPAIQNQIRKNALQQHFPDLPSQINPNAVKKHILPDGTEMPALGLGTYGSDHYSPETVANAVLEAVRLGYRHIDCAAVYANQNQIGMALQQAMKTGVAREQLFITSKLWNDQHAAENVIPACKKTLEELQLSYLDLFLIHWPFPNFHAPGVDVSSRDPHAQPYNHQSYMQTWHQMERLVEIGLVRNIGTSNMTIPKLKRVLEDAKIQPVCEQMELHPHFQQPELFQFVREHNMIAAGYCPIGSPNRPERDRTPQDTVDTSDPVITAIASRLKVHPAVVCILWAVQRGQVPIAFSVKPQQMLANLMAATGSFLTNEEMQAVAAIDKHNRLIKGHVFLWKENQTWEALWDVEGQITPP